MRVTYHDTESETTSEPIVEGPKVILYDHRGAPLKRPIGFTVDNRTGRGVTSQTSHPVRKITDRITY